MGAAERKCLGVVLVVVLVLGLGGWGEGCWEQEKRALLQLKPFFNVQLEPGSGTNHYVLYDWVEESSDCCEWERVECDATSRRVIGLSLANFLAFDRPYGDYGWYLNVSLFLPFKELKSLSLSGNGIAGFLDNEGFEKLALKLKKLEVLDLSFNFFNDSSILSSLVEISSLKSLNLSYNQLGRLPTKLSGTVETLDLKGTELDDNNLMSLSELSSLKYLDLSDNFINGSIHNTELKNLINLKELHLSGNEIESLNSFHGIFQTQFTDGLINLEVLTFNFGYHDNSILSYFGPFLRSLTFLYIHNGAHPDFGYSEGSIDIKDARRVKSLKGVAVNNSDPHLLQQSLNLFPSLKTLHFDLGFDCPANKTVITQGLLQLKNLESLQMNEFSLQNSFLENIGAMTSLKTLSLTFCGLNGTLTTKGICQLTRLQELDISNNELMGVLPYCFSNLTFLQHLDLSSNQFYGNLLAISPLQSLTYIDLSNNQFQIPSSLKPFFNHSKLKLFYGNNNNITYAETELHSLAPRFQLNHINLSCCGDARPLPKFLYHQHELQSVDLSNINLTGEFPSWLLENNTELKTLFLINNSLSGHFRLPFHSPMKLLELDVSSNFIEGHIPVEIGISLPGLTILNISKNHLDGSIPSSIGDMKPLVTLDLSNNRLFGSIPSSIGDMKLLGTLDLSNNRLFGEIPENLATGCSSLRYLSLANNRLQGQIFSSNFNLTNLEELHLANNNFTGSIPNSLSNSSFLSVIDISYNNLSGRIPRTMGNMSELVIILLPNNRIEGPIPKEFCQLPIGVLDLTMNNISGTLPSCFDSSRIKHVYLSKNRLQGPIPNKICESSELVMLDLSDNQLTGNIPNCISKLSELSYLVLKHNNLEGQISNQLCLLGKLSLIDLSHNNLSGRIPNCLKLTTYKDANNNSLETSESIELTTKNRSYTYKGRILNYLSGIDLSFNKLTGKIPHEMGNFHKIVMLNLSHNSLAGPIPQSLSNLEKIESLDLSYNNLSGSIPPQFVRLYSLAYFNVSYNNLSGKPPPRAFQFASDFDENSYWGNRFLCGEPLPINCSTIPNQPTKDGEDDEDGGLIDIESFYVTFTVSYIMVLLCIAAVMYINPHWRRAWFYLVESSITSCFYFVIDNLPAQFHCGNI